MSSLFAGRKRTNRKKRGGTFSRIERSYGVFERSFTLPVTVKSDAIEARYNGGILTTTLPKREEAKEKVIDVSAK
jgi:HSP20 family protein